VSKIGAIEISGPCCFPVTPLMGAADRGQLFWRDGKEGFPQGRASVALAAANDLFGNVESDSACRLPTAFTPPVL
jgi:hypothetical protein